MEAIAAGARSESFRSLLDDRDAFRAWYDAALPIVYGLVLARCGGDATIATDIAQEAFLAAVRDRDHFDGESDAVTWVCGIARHKLADHFRRVARDQRRHLRLVREPRPRAPDAMDVVDARSSVLKALRALPEMQRVVLAMHYLDDLSVRDIASTLGRRESSVESLLTRGRDGFRRVYDPLSGGSHAG